MVRDHGKQYCLGHCTVWITVFKPTAGFFFDVWLLWLIYAPFMVVHFDFCFVVTQDQNYFIIGDSLFPNQNCFKCNHSLHKTCNTYCWIESLLGLRFSVVFSHHPFNKREIMSGSANLANYSVLVTSWLLEENLQLLISKSAEALTTTYEHLSSYTQINVVFSPHQGKDRDHDRKPQPIKMLSCDLSFHF